MVLSFARELNRTVALSNKFGPLDLQPACVGEEVVGQGEGEQQSMWFAVDDEIES